jgi:hypothetical protein
MSDSSGAKRFFESLAPDFETSKPLRWGFLLSGIPEDRVGPLMDELGGLGFTEVEPMVDEEHEGRFRLGFAEVGVHTAGSFARRVEVVERLAEREGLELSDYSAARPDIDA